MISTVARTTSMPDLMPEELPTILLELADTCFLPLLVAAAQQPSWTNRQLVGPTGSWAVATGPMKAHQTFDIGMTYV